MICAVNWPRKTWSRSIIGIRKRWARSYSILGTDRKTGRCQFYHRPVYGLRGGAAGMALICIFELPSTRWAFPHGFLPPLRLNRCHGHFSCVSRLLPYFFPDLFSNPHETANRAIVIFEAHIYDAAGLRFAIPAGKSISSPGFPHTAPAGAPETLLPPGKRPGIFSTRCQGRTPAGAPAAESRGGCPQRCLPACPD